MINAARRASEFAAIIAGLGLAASLYGAPRLAAALQVIVVILLAGSILLLADHKERRP